MLGLIYTLLLLSVPFIRKKELEIELSKYNFDIEDDVKEEYIVESSSSPVIFKKAGWGLSAIQIGIQKRWFIF